MRLSTEAIATLAMQCSSIAALQKGIDAVLVERLSAEQTVSIHKQKLNELDERVKKMQDQLRDLVRDLRSQWKDEDEPAPSNQ